MQTKFHKSSSLSQEDKLMENCISFCASSAHFIALINPGAGCFPNFDKLNFHFALLLVEWLITKVICHWVSPEAVPFTVKSNDKINDDSQAVSNKTSFGFLPVL